MKIGIIGGSGLEKCDVLQDIEELEVETPYGKPSSSIKKGLINGVEVFILSRHGENHEITPTNVNNRANIYALADLGCKQILATTAVGSLKENIAPGDFVIANQFIDFTKHRVTTFFDDFKKEIKHTSLADPFSEELRNYLIDSCNELNLNHHKVGTVVTIEGPRFSTRAESFMFKKFAHIINMSTAPEAILAKEAGIEYAVVAMSTDYDCWKKEEKPVTWEEIEKVMKQNSENVKKVLVRAIEKISSTDNLGNIVKNSPKFSVSTISRQPNTINEIADKDTLSSDIEFVKSKIRTIPNFPKQGIMFRDVTTLFGDAQGMKKVIDIFYSKYKNQKIDVVAGIEARGFIIGAILAEKLGVGFVPIRKKGKLPFEVESCEYKLEYGTDRIEIHKDAISSGQKVLLIDDLIATGGTCAAAAQLVEKLGGEIISCGFIIDLPALKGKDKLSKYNVFSIVEFEGE